MKKLLPFMLGIFLSGAVVFAQEKPMTQQGDLWICPSGDIAMFSIHNLAYGGGISIGYGRGGAIGFKVAYMLDPDGMIKTLELNVLLRLYFLGASCSGPFIQLDGGPALFARDENLQIPAEKGTISAGLSLGWRFLLGKYFVLEPALRGGYPYIAGGGISMGIHF